VSAYRPIPKLEELLRRNTRVPSFQPPVTQALLAADGSVWLRREDVHVAAVRWTILDPAGEPAGEVSVPAGTRILYVDADTVWGVERDVLDVEYAVRYRLRTDSARSRRRRNGRVGSARG
jgi:hypothetical protein